MKIIKKINNNVAIGIDGNGNEVVVFGRGVGFERTPYELTDFSKVEQTFYNVDRRFYDLFQDLDEKVLLLVSRLVEKIQMSSSQKWNPNLTIILADHIQFALERYRSGMRIEMPYLDEMEESEPKIHSYAFWIVKNVNHHFQVRLSKGEISCIAMHLLNAQLGAPKQEQESHEEKRIRIFRQVVAIIEEHFKTKLPGKGSSYFRFRQHINYFVKRKENNEEFSGQNEELFEMMSKQYPDVYACVLKINDYLYHEYQSNCSMDELLYLMIHINRLIHQNKLNSGTEKTDRT